MPSQEDYLDKLLKEMESGMVASSAAAPKDMGIDMGADEDFFRPENNVEKDLTGARSLAVSQGQEEAGMFDITSNLAAETAEFAMSEELAGSESFAMPADQVGSEGFAMPAGQTVSEGFAMPEEIAETKDFAAPEDLEAKEPVASAMDAYETELPEQDAFISQVPEVDEAGTVSMSETEVETGADEIIQLLDTGAEAVQSELFSMQEFENTQEDSGEQSLGQEMKQPASDDSFDMSDMDELLKFAREGVEEDTDVDDESMSEEEIEKLINQNRIMGEASESTTLSQDGEDDLMKLLDAAAGGDSSLQDIQDMLQKSDNNEAVDASILQESDPVEDLLRMEAMNAAEDEFAGMSERQKKALIKKREKEERAAKKKAEKEAKKAEREAKKAEKLAKKTGKQPAEQGNEQPGNNGDPAEAQSGQEADNLLGATVLDEPMSDPAGDVENFLSQDEIDAVLTGGASLGSDATEKSGDAEDETSEENGSGKIGKKGK
ncbi:MAG: hypothetical protein IJ794_16720 [Lachnospiraceae bacterium]|nr:hypothetical protein [Lachnospiraceae bacterium]